MGICGDDLKGGGNGTPKSLCGGLITHWRIRIFILDEPGLSTTEFNVEHFVLIHLKLHLNAELTLCALGNISAASIRSTIIHFQHHSALIELVCYINLLAPLRTPAYLYGGFTREERTSRCFQGRNPPLPN